MCTRSCKITSHLTCWVVGCAAAKTLTPPNVEVLRAAQRLEAQLGVPIAPKAPDRRARPGIAEPAAANPWGPRPAPKSWGLEAAIAALSETWVDSQLAQVRLRAAQRHALRCSHCAGTRWAVQGGRGEVVRRVRMCLCDRRHWGAL